MAICNVSKAELTYCVMYSDWRGEAFTWTWRSHLAWPRRRGAPEKVFSGLSDELMWRRLCLSPQRLMVARMEWTVTLVLFVLLIFTKSLWYPPLVDPVTGDSKEVLKRTAVFTSRQSAHTLRCTYSFGAQTFIQHPKTYIWWRLQYP